MFGEPGWSSVEGGIQGFDIVTWRRNNKLLNFSNLLDSLNKYKIFQNNFGIISHPVSLKYSYIDGILTTYPKAFYAVEGWNNYYNNKDNEGFRRLYNELLKKYRLWVVAVTDWQGYRAEGNIIDKGCNVILLDNKYNTQSKDGKRFSCINALSTGQFYASGINGFTITKLDVDTKDVFITFSTKVDSIKCITSNGIRLIAKDIDNLKYSLSKGDRFVRFESFLNNDFIFTQPIFFKETIKYGI